MTEMTTCASLLKDGDSELLSFLSLWAEHREVPVPFIDWLTEKGLEGSASAARWCLDQPLLPTYTRCNVYAKGLSKPFPVHLEEGSATDVRKRWSWIAVKGQTDAVSMAYKGHSDRVEWLPPLDGETVSDFETLNDALCYLLDNWSETT